MDEAAGKPLPFYRSLAFKLGTCSGALMLVSILVFAFFSMKTQRSELMSSMVDEAMRFSEAFTNSLKHGMWKADVGEIDSVVQAVGRQEGISVVRIFNHAGQIRFSTQPRELGRNVDKKATACGACHSKPRPGLEVSIPERTRIYHSVEGQRILGIVTPVFNERHCSSAVCHMHPEAQRILGVLDVGLSLEATDRAIAGAVRKTIYFALALFLGITALLVAALLSFVGRPVRRMVEATHRLSQGEYGHRVQLSSRDELGVLAESFNRMGERIRAREEELYRQHEEYQALFDNVPTYIAVVDGDYRIVQANRNFKSTFGDRVGEKCFQAYKGLRDRCRDCPVERTFLDRKPHQSEERGRTKEGEEIHYLVYTAPVLDSRGEPLYAIEMSVDLRETKRLEKELRASREFLDNVIENSIHGIVAVDAAGRVIVFNRSAEHILGYKASKVIGSVDLERFFPRDFTKRILAALDGRLEDGALKTVHQETWLRSEDGERIPVQFSGVILMEEDSTVGAVGFFQDLRHLKILEREKVQAEKLAVVGQTVAGLAHGVKNILTGLEGGVYVVQTAMKRGEDSLLQKGWDMVERNIEKISSLVKDLLSYSKERVPESEWIDPNGLAEEVSALYHEKARQSGIRLVMDLDPNMGRAYLDPKGIHVCLTNLLSNAIDACLYHLAKEKHQVVVRTRRNVDESVTFEVEDDGSGMTEEVKEKLFTSFFSTKGTGGTGLGLLVTHKIVNEHGGRISVDTQPGRGSCFRITIPQEEAQPPEEEETAST